MLVTALAVVGIVSAAIAGVIVGLTVIHVSMGMAAAVALGTLVFAIGAVLFIGFTIRGGRRDADRINALVAEQERRRTVAPARRGGRAG